MFCPTCGRDNRNELKFCASCGTNLEVVSQVLSGSSRDWFTRVDSDFDQLIARYSEHVFKDSPANSGDRSVSNSWKILGKGVLTSLVDIFLAAMIWIVFVIRLYVLGISTPFRLLSERSKRLKSKSDGLGKATPRGLPEASPDQWVAGPVPSVSEHTTEILQRYQQPRPRQTPNQD